MPARYAPLPTAAGDPLLNTEMEAAFDDPDDSDDDDDQPIARAETRPLQPHSSSPLFQSTPAAHPATPRGPAVYDFENFDYASLPPPGSPPPPTSIAIPNSFGNSNGLIPASADVEVVEGPRMGWARRAARAVLPSSYVRSWGLDYEPPVGVVGGGTGNDGVFANVTAKPSRPLQIREGDEIYLVPEEAQKDVPPSYAVAQADAVPPYWETTVHAPSSSDAYGEMIIDALPTGSLFSFLWNLLISISFQFVGFLLTYLLHTTHAARFGSRAGLGVTLIQYGFALRARSEEDASSGGGWFGMGGAYGQGGLGNATPTFETKEAAEDYYRALNITMVDGQPSGPIPSATTPGATMDDISYVNDATTDWLSFFLMTIGWFLLLTSVLGFWRVKRWERNILASQQDATSVAAEPRAARSDGSHRVFGLAVHDFPGLLRGGLGFSRTRDADESEDEPAATPMHRDRLLQGSAHDPERQRQLVQAFREDDQLMETMRAAGML
ncbi:hypothetical protein FA95DRAFT_1495554 [Auriscalpium vulgare]|uniref:Uncharacterized protein n=1 Tax=Auriscalpium vulgare TaxID=40419 RepID=A0ACB8RNU5_9AGAM|nr:hypothetical protein FA95DRAFT_1495554 [Auriscalpium vulgare]